jgi:NifB/MoaA-like Fe-S oxidoreductase
MKHFIDHGIEIHAQVVLCPTLNDGAQLVRTINELAELHPGIVSTAIVPLGITERHKYRHRLVPVTDEYCAELIDLVAPIQEQMRKRLGTSFAFLGDEFYIRAGRPIPPQAHYRIVRGSGADDDAYPQIEDGVGMVRQFFEAHAQRLKQLDRMRSRGRFTPEQAHRIYGTLATGLVFYPMLSEAVGELNERFGTRLHVAAVENTFFGKEITVAGLLAGVDFLKARDQYRGEFLMIPPHSFREHDRRFLDGLTVGDLAAELVLPIRRSWHEVLGLPEPGKGRGPILSHDYGSVTSIQV